MCRALALLLLGAALLGGSCSGPSSQPRNPRTGSNGLGGLGSTGTGTGGFGYDPGGNVGDPWIDKPDSGFANVPHDASAATGGTGFPDPNPGTGGAYQPVDAGTGGAGGVIDAGSGVSLDARTCNPNGNGPNSCRRDAGSTGGTSGTPDAAATGGTGGKMDAAATGGTGGKMDAAAGGTGGKMDAAATGGTGGKMDAAAGGTGGKMDAAATGGTSGTVWMKANLTHFTSYPAPGSEECIVYNGCMWAGYFAFVSGKQPESWVMANNIAAIHEKDTPTYKLKTLRLRQGTKMIDVKVYDMCSDSDCSGCCSQNAKQNGLNFLIDIEKYTMQRFGSGDGIVEWQCLDCN